MAANRKELQNDAVLAAYERNGGGVRATARELGVHWKTVTTRLRKMGKLKPVAAGTVKGIEAESHDLPAKGRVKRYILTSAQNNTFVHEGVWAGLMALAEHYGAEILVGTYSYNQNAYGKMAVKRGKDKAKEQSLWYANEVLPFVCDERRELAKGLVWCGEMNILPTAANPLAGLESYSARASAVFPHAKLAMRSVPTMQGEGTKLNYTTGTVTKRNYIQKREGLIAEHHHVYGGLLVEVNSAGNWWVRQLNADDRGTLQDLKVLVKDGKVVSESALVEAVTWGDMHATWADEAVVKCSLGMLNELQPAYQFMHDVMEGSSINHHRKDNPHFKFWNWLRGLHRLEEELKRTAALIRCYDREWSKIVVVDSNHDDPWIQRWLREYDYRKDPANSVLFLRAQAHLYSRIHEGAMPRDVNMTEWCLRHAGLATPIKFLLSDESYLICNRRIECGQHGHLGPAGARGTPENLSKMGRRANTAHTHSAGIWNGLYVAGTSSRLRWDYNRGPSGWTNSHIVTYPSGKRSIITIYDGKWRA